MEHMMNTMGWGYMSGMPLQFMLLALLAKVVISFLAVWLFVYLMAQWKLPPFKKK